MSELAAVSEITTITRRGTPENAASSAGRILIIDDEAEIRESLETLLQLEGYTVVVAGSGSEGLAQIGVRTFDVVLLDLALPDKNGMDVMSEIRMLHPQQPIIMITAYGTVENAVRAMQSGATNFIQKPWDNEKLLADVRAAVARQKAEEENIQLKRALKQCHDNKKCYHCTLMANNEHNAFMHMSPRNLANIAVIQIADSFKRIPGLAWLWRRRTGRNAGAVAKAAATAAGKSSRAA